LQETGSAGGERSGPGLQTILCQSTLAGRDIDESGDDSQKYWALKIHRGNREIARVQKDGETGDRVAQSRRPQTPPKPRRHYVNGPPARCPRRGRRKPGAEGCTPT